MTKSIFFFCHINKELVFVPPGRDNIIYGRPLMVFAHAFELDIKIFIVELRKIIKNLTLKLGGLRAKSFYSWT